MSSTYPGLPPELFLRSDGAGPFAINDASELVPEDRSARHMLELMRGDAARVKAHWGEALIRRFYPSVFVAWAHRVAHWLHINGLRPLAIVVMWACHAITGVEIRPGASLGPGLIVVHPSGVVINGGTIAGAGLQLYGANLLGSNEANGQHGTPRLGDDVILGHGAMAIGPILIGDGAIVGALSLVLHDVPAGGRVKGIPAK
jgi:serine O-acetyltransferase